MLSLNLDHPTMNRLEFDRQRVIDMFHKVRYEGALTRLWKRLTRRPICLRSLNDATLHGGRALGHQTVPIANIVGSEGRTRDFDAAFTPLSERTRERWASVAEARLRGRALPAVLLVRTEDGYYVRDGHHRISVARALGEEFVEADVIAWS